MEFGMNDKLHHLEEALNWLLNIWSQIKRIPTTITITEMTTMGVDRSSRAKQRSYNSHDFQGMTQSNGSTVWNNSLNTRSWHKTKRCPWLLTTLKGRPINGGSGFIGCYRKKGM
jgi:hypothetical protein